VLEVCSHSRPVEIVTRPRPERGEKHLKSGTSHAKFQFDWIHAFLNNSAKGLSQADLFVTWVPADF
jgi:hypothetical protein